ncbi:MAG: MCP four helix bundle domain-containing protein, partial [Gammaproteobacteria bacterium]|nr:MCP four helix bundle domain-containing protein [Gammaproteobacteria bacterium]
MVRGRYNAKLIGLGFSIVIATMILLAAISIYYLTNTRDVFSRVVSQHNVQLRVMSEFLRLARDRSLTVQHMLLVKDPFELDEHRMKMSEIAQEYLTLREELLDTELNKEEMKIIDDQNRQTNITGRMQNEVADL